MPSATKGREIAAGSGVISTVGTLRGEGYTVVARRYRPQRFEEVVGQDHIVQALRNAIRMDRVAQAYLFAGTRGVGKTSMARIFAKCLNCVTGPTESPCLQCDICQAIATGEDVDVIEIDGASNNGVDSVRELRQNASLRPSRTRFKIYYIDEVHMLSTGAFNALLKTLEEPPGHVKFFFATTEPNKIPVTVLSRCQRYDFAGIAPDQIVAALAAIAEREGVRAEPDALRLVARRAAGSMRDAQSLLEPLLATGAPLTVEAVHRALGTASDERVLELIEALADHDPRRTLQILDAATAESVQPVDLLNGALDFLRDVMVLAAGAGDDVTLLAALPNQRPRLHALAERWPLDAILAALQILAETRARLRGSPHGRLIVELGLVRVARLEDLTDLGELIGHLTALEAGAPNSAPPSAVKKKWSAATPAEADGSATMTEVPRPSAARDPRASASPSATPAPSSAPGAVSLEVVQAVWDELLGRIGFRIGKALSQARPTAIAPPSVLVISVPEGYNWVIQECGTPEARARIETLLGELIGRPVTIRFERTDGASAEAIASPSSSTLAALRDELEHDPLVRQVRDLFDARPVHLDTGEDPDAAT